MRHSFLILLAVLLPAAALTQVWAQDAAAGNLPADFYPKPACVTPNSTKPPTPTLSDPGAVASYNFKVGQINKQVTAYNSCMQAYTAKVDNDIQGILATVNGAVAEAMGRAAPPPPAAAGNLPLGFYPRNNCTKPDRDALGSAPSPADREAMTAYNLRAKTFNSQTAAFNSCLAAYQDGAKRDIGRIQAISQAATGHGAAEPSSRQ
ncbi:MAG TPA: hypothetical protein VFI23_01640 [Rhizomicrobium sp.]|nr:hypothetical protein [Rhizomicrobium sp.]